jgi:Tol biopolymer transport system component
VDARGMNNEEIYVMNTDGSERTRLTDIPGYDHWPPTWSPDGTRIAFTSDGTEDNGEIYVMNSDGSSLTQLTDDPAYDSFPAWRP